jgi:hypothetical protein
MTQNLLKPPQCRPKPTRAGIHKIFTRTGVYDSAKIVKLSPCFVRLDDNLASTFIFIRRNKKSSGRVGGGVQLCVPKNPKKIIGNGAGFSYAAKLSRSLSEKAKGLPRYVKRH